MLVTVVVLLALVVGGDFLVRRAVEAELEKRLTASLDASARVEVSLPAFPVTLQLLRGRLDRLEAHTAGARVGQLRLSELRATARNVRFSLTKLLQGRGRIRVGSADATAVLTEDQVNEALGRNNAGVTLQLEEERAILSGGALPDDVEATLQTDAEAVVVVARGREITRLDVTPESEALSLEAAEVRDGRVLLTFAVDARALSWAPAQPADFVLTVNVLPCTATTRTSSPASAPSAQVAVHSCPATRT